MKQLSVLLVSFLILPLYGVTASDIEGIRQRTEGNRMEVSDADRSLINEFWETSLNTMLLSDNAQDIVDIRKRVEEQAGREPLSFYTTAYINAAKEKLRTAFENAAQISDVKKRRLIEQNLMILTAHLKNPSLADIALPHVNDKNTVIRYWAVKALTNSGVIQMLTADVTADKEMETKILTALNERLAFEDQVEIQMMIINFAAAMDNPVAREILLTVAEKRIEAYKNWSIEPKYTNLDTRLLIAMGNIAMRTQNAEVKSIFAHKFAELYALVFQAYMSGANVLTEAQLEHLIGVILEVDRTVLDKMLNVTQTGIFRALQRKVGLEREYETIFGDRLRAGDLATIYKFDYGKDSAGRPITEPPSIGQPPATSGEDEQ